MNFKAKHFLHKLNLIAILGFTFFAGTIAIAQNGTYELKNKNGSYCYISIVKKGNHIDAEIFAWWNTASARTGLYYGEGTLIGNQCTLKSDENDPECKVTLVLEQDKIRASFENCAVDNVPEDFNGVYSKITNATAGDYRVSVPRSYFHKKPDAASKLNSYVVKGNKVTLNMDRIEAGNWVYVYYVDSKGKETAGYVVLTDLRKMEK
ncbi:hypothetical protein [Chryseobacterium luteum]|uniref:Uncharacterized protein n=1 Tax=Chryseobacterium luteum TaxID=421531 RepID=A0A085ZF60_9FLAO|nr:hypothetical protein [Chryseobacterium luteum]KFF03074.1 hypothetical protein IX38_11920 [Chryseobacterium luteum]